MHIPEKLYQPIAFAEYKHFDDNASRSRKDCEERYQNIKKSLEAKFAEKTLLDIGSANAYFSYRFLTEGGGQAFGVEKEKEWRELSIDIAKEKKLNFSCVPMLKDLDQSRIYDIGLYMDLHFHEGINALPWITPRVKTLFASCSGDGSKHNQAFFDELRTYYEFVKPVFAGTANRIVFLCTGQKSILAATSAAPVAKEEALQEKAAEAPVAAPKPKKPKKVKPKAKSEDSNPSA